MSSHGDLCDIVGLRNWGPTFIKFLTFHLILISLDLIGESSFYAYVSSSIPCHLASIGTHMLWRAQDFHLDGVKLLLDFPKQRVCLVRFLKHSKVLIMISTYDDIIINFPISIECHAKLSINSMS